MARKYIDKQLLKSLLLMVSLIEARHHYAGGHLWRVSHYCRVLADAVGLPAGSVFLSRLGGFLHDIGKISIPEAILNKRDPLSEAEFATIGTHPEVGATLIQAHPLGELAILAVQQHREWVSGQGYPAHLK